MHGRVPIPRPLRSCSHDMSAVSRCVCNKVRASTETWWQCMHLQASELHLPFEGLHSSHIVNPSTVIQCGTHVHARLCPHCSALPHMILLGFGVWSVIYMHNYPLNVRQMSANTPHRYRCIQKSQHAVPYTKQYCDAGQH